MIEGEVSESNEMRLGQEMVMRKESAPTSFLFPREKGTTLQVWGMG